MFGRKKTKLEKAQEAGFRAIEQVQETLRHLPVEEWQDKLHDLKENAGDLAERTRFNVSSHAQAVGGRAQSAAERAREAAERAREVAERAREAAEHEAHQIAGKREALQETLSGATKLVASRLRHEQDQAVDAAQEVAEDVLPERESGATKWLWLLAGMLLGGMIALVLAPASGRRSRALLRDKLSQGKQHAAELGKSVSESVSEKAGGVAEHVKDVVHEAQDKVSDAAQASVQDKAGVAPKKSAGSAEAEKDSDETIADRVRTELGQNEATRDLERINVSCAQGIVTLRGPQLKAEQSRIEDIVRGVTGVKDVKSELDAGDGKPGKD